MTRHPLFSLAILFLLLALGELIALITRQLLPGSIWGLLLLLGALSFGILKEEAISPACDFLLKNLAFFFIPAGVGIMNYWGIISNELIVILAAALGSTLLVLVGMGYLNQKVFGDRRPPSHKQEHTS